MKKWGAAQDFFTVLYSTEASHGCNVKSGQILVTSHAGLWEEKAHTERPQPVDSNPGPSCSELQHCVTSQSFECRSSVCIAECNSRATHFLHISEKTPSSAYFDHIILLMHSTQSSSTVKPPLKRQPVSEWSYWRLSNDNDCIWKLLFK